MTQTPSVHLTQPVVGGDTGLWGGETNTNWTLVDRAINQIVAVSIPDTNISLTADGSTSDQSLYLIYNFTGALTADRTVTLPSNVKTGFAVNNTSGGFNVILSAGGTTSAVPPDGRRWAFYCDATNVSLPSYGFGAGGTTGTAIMGIGSSSSAPTGAIGELLTGSGSGAMTSTVARNFVTLSVTAGNWDIWGTLGIVGASTTLLGVTAAVSTTSATVPSSPPTDGEYQFLQTSFGAGANQRVSTGIAPISFSTTTNVYLVGVVRFTGSSPTGSGVIYARRRA